MAGLNFSSMFLSALENGQRMNQQKEQFQLQYEASKSANEDEMAYRRQALAQTHDEFLANQGMQSQQLLISQRQAATQEAVARLMATIADKRQKAAEASTNFNFDLLSLTPQGREQLPLVSPHQMKAFQAGPQEAHPREPLFKEPLPGATLTFEAGNTMYNILGKGWDLFTQMPPEMTNPQNPLAVQSSRQIVSPQDLSSFRLKAPKLIDSFLGESGTISKKLQVPGFGEAAIQSFIQMQPYLAADPTLMNIPQVAKLSGFVGSILNAEKRKQMATQRAAASQSQRQGQLQMMKEELSAINTDVRVSKDVGKADQLRQAVLSKYSALYNSLTPEEYASLTGSR